MHSSITAQNFFLGGNNFGRKVMVAQLIVAHFGGAVLCRYGGNAVRIGAFLIEVDGSRQHHLLTYYYVAA